MGVAFKKAVYTVAFIKADCSGDSFLVQEPAPNLVDLLLVALEQDKPSPLRPLCSTPLSFHRASPETVPVG